MDVHDGVRDTGADVMLVTDLDNVFYLSGFSGSNGALALASDGKATLVTDARYRDQAHAQCADIHIVIDREPTKRALLFATGQDHGPARGTEVGSVDQYQDTQDAPVTRATSDVTDARPDPVLRPVAFEADNVSVSLWRSLSRLVGADSLVATTRLIESRRRRKDEDEISLIERACRIAERALLRTTAGVRPGMTEREVSRDLDFAMLAGGADDRAFPTIVAAGPHSAIPHHGPTEREIAPGDLLKIDFGVRLGGYHSDITRTFVVGANPTAEQSRWHHAVAQAATAARASLVAGASGAGPYRVARDALAAEGLEDAFTHGLGHGVGLAIHEAPIMAAGCDDTLLVDDVLTIEPGVYFPGVGGVRIEDTLVVTDTGSRCLTTVSRDLVRLG
jgi:Xaa-Pro aminopeptidase